MSNPRIISGKARGLRLQSVPGDTTRPITDRVKEALYNIIGNDIINASMLDLYGGTGSVGIEALSRGASFVRFIDHNVSAVNIIKANLKHTRLQDQAEVHQADTFVYLHRPADKIFDYIYVAPPQFKEMWQRTMHSLDDNPSWLAEDAWIIVQIAPQEYSPQTYHLFDEFDQRKYGSTLLVFFQLKG
jgi:16S rRNA (guanine966-N2)-methyltransferase